MLLSEERKTVAHYGKKLITTGLVKGTGGNISLVNRAKTLMAITPSGVDYDQVDPEDVVVVDMDGKRVEGHLNASSELAFHLALVKQRPDIKAVVHTHSDFATALACLRWELPAVHYLIGSAGSVVPLAPYATFGTQALADGICQTIGDGNAVLLANHGLVTVGVNLKQAFSTAEYVEYVAKIYLMTKSVGTPVLLNMEEMRAVIEKLENYGKQPDTHE